MIRKFIEFIDSNYDGIIFVLFVYAFVITVLFVRIVQLWYPQSTIVLHDYGQVFESEVDWKIWRLEHERQ